MLLDYIHDIYTMLHEIKLQKKMVVKMRLIYYLVLSGIQTTSCVGTSVYLLYVHTTYIINTFMLNLKQNSVETDIYGDFSHCVQMDT
jgi:hypothetical protein